jgi:hypothetical protein
MVNTDKTYDDSKRVGEMLGAMEAARLFVLDALHTGRFVFEKGLVSAYDATRQELKFLFKRFTVFDFVFGNLSLLGLLSGVVIFFSGFGLLGYQTVVWLQEGVWTAMPLMMVFNFIFDGTGLGAWMQNPDSWMGLQQIMEWLLIHTPISLVLIVNGLILSMLMTSVIIFAVMVRRFQFKHREQG